jgi:hypothetical protein
MTDSTMTREEVALENARNLLDDAREALRSALGLARLFPDQGVVQKGIEQARSAAWLEVETASAAYVAALAAVAEATRTTPPPGLVHNPGAQSWTISKADAERLVVPPLEPVFPVRLSDAEVPPSLSGDVEAAKALAELRVLLANCKEALKSPYPSERTWLGEQLDRALALVEKAGK